MRSLLLVLIVSIATCSFCRGDGGTCSKIVPLKDTDWTKLIGTWYHLMYIPGASMFLNCRRMQISSVDEKAKEVDIDFNEISYSSSSKEIRKDLIYFKWYEDPGRIYTARKRPKDLQLKQSKYSLKKHSGFVKASQESKAFCHTLISTDYTNYIIMVQCKKGDIPMVWLSMKNLSIEANYQQDIKRQLETVGISLATLDFNSTSTCGHL